MSEEKQVRWPYGEKLREGSSIQAILNYIAGTDGLSERQALWEFAQKKQNGEYPWDGGGGPGVPGPPGEDGKGWTGGSYDDASGVVTFTSDDGLGFATGDLRGADGEPGAGVVIKGTADWAVIGLLSALSVLRIAL